MYCTNCGAKLIEENANFCQTCGSPITREPETLTEQTVKTHSSAAPVHTPPSTSTSPSAQSQYTPPTTVSPPATVPATSPPQRKGVHWCCWASGCGCLLILVAMILTGIVIYPKLQAYFEDVQSYLSMAQDPEVIPARLALRKFLTTKDRGNSKALEALLHPALVKDFHTNVSKLMQYDQFVAYKVLGWQRTPDGDVEFRVQYTPLQGKKDASAIMVWKYTFRQHEGNWLLLWADLEGQKGDEMPDQLRTGSKRTE
ncbi:MAG: zinc-ribbon domain-containing protein [Candidatus Zipacnadales bacterium]